MVQETLGSQFDPPSIREMLRSGIKQTRFTVGQYTSARKDILEQLIANEAVVYPDYLRYASQEDKWREVINIVNGLEDGQTLVIPLSLGIIPFPDGIRLRKRGELVGVPRYANQRNPVSSVDAFRDAVAREKVGDLRVGYDWDGSNWADRRLRVTTMYDRIRAAIVDEQVPDAVSVSRYDSTRRVFQRGAQIVAENVPSLSGNEDYRVVLEHVPVYLGGRITPEAVEASYAFHDLHQCDRKDWNDVVYDRERTEDERIATETMLDQHTMIAYRQARREILRQEPSWRIPNLFPDPSEDKIEFFWRTINQVAFEDPEKISADEAPNRVVTPSEMEVKTKITPIGTYKPFVEVMLHNSVGRANELAA